jgi:hypothetical protein
MSIDILKFKKEKLLISTGQVDDFTMSFKHIGSISTAC